MVSVRQFGTLALVGTVALVAAGCGGGDDAATDTSSSPTPAPTPSTPSGTTPSAAGSTGLVGSGAGDGSATGGATPALPDLDGGDVRGGLDGLANDRDGKAAFAARVATTAVEEVEETADADGIESTLKDPTLDPIDVKPEPVVEQQLAGAVMLVNGMVHNVPVGTAFPRSRPMFVLSSATRDDVEIRLIAGEFVSGKTDGTVLDKGVMKQLVNSTEQITYRIKYVRGMSATDSLLSDLDG